jgi:hypothetical protein
LVEGNEKSGVKRPSYGFIFLRGLLTVAFFEISRKRKERGK